MSTVLQTKPARVDAVVSKTGFSTARIYDLVRRDIIPHIKIGGRVFFDMERVSTWMDGLAAGGSSEPGAWRSMQ